MDKTNYLISIIAKEFGVTLNDIKGKSRKREHVYARHATVFIMYTRLHYSGKEIATIINRDSSTVYQSNMVAQDIMFTDAEYEKKVDQALREVLRAGYQPRSNSACP